MLMAFSTSAACRNWWRGMCVSDTTGSPREAESDFVEETDTMRVRPAIPVVVLPVSNVGDVVPVATGPSASILDHYTRSQGSAALGDQEITGIPGCACIGTLRDPRSLGGLWPPPWPQVCTQGRSCGLPRPPWRSLRHVGDRRRRCTVECTLESLVTRF